MKVLVSLALCSLLGACASMDFTTARSVSMKPGKGGVLTLNPPQDPKARAKAEDIMRQTCGAKSFEIAEEGEAVVGTKTKGTAEHKSGASGIRVAGLSLGGAGPSTETETEQKQVTEWRITYDCK